jgi:hypothetical protein
LIGDIVIVLHWAQASIVKLHTRLFAPEDRERGDVPGWVMITLMTAIIVIAIWGIASSQLKDMLNNAFGKVNITKNPGS